MSIYKKGNNYFIDYYFRGRRLRESTGPNRQLALEMFHKRKSEIAERKFFPNRTKERILFRDMTKLYYELHSLVNKRSARTTEIYLLRRLDVFFGDKYLDQITPMEVEEYRAQRMTEVKPASVNREHQCLRHVFTKAMEWEKCSTNPAKGLKALAVNNKRLRYLSNEEIQTLLSHSDERIKPIVITALNTGMRRGELKNMKWKDIDFERGLIYVLKTKSGISRVLPMNSLLRKDLEGLHQAGPWVFDTSNLRKLYERAVTDARLYDVTFHTLRHTFASHLVMAGIDLRTVGDLLGHQKLDMTMRYAHLSRSHKQTAVEILGSRWTPIWTPSDSKACKIDGANIDKLIEKSVGKA